MFRSRLFWPSLSLEICAKVWVWVVTVVPTTLGQSFRRQSCRTAEFRLIQIKALKTWRCQDLANCCGSNSIWSVLRISIRLSNVLLASLKLLKKANMQLQTNLLWHILQKRCQQSWADHHAHGAITCDFQCECDALKFWLKTLNKTLINSSWIACSSYFTLFMV